MTVMVCINDTGLHQLWLLRRHQVGWRPKSTVHGACHTRGQTFCECKNFKPPPCSQEAGELIDNSIKLDRSDILTVFG